MKPLRVGLLGLAGAGRELFDALRASQHVDLVAVADQDRSLTAKLAERAGAQGRDDYRRLIAESAASALDAVFVALPAVEAQEYLRQAAGCKLAAYVVPPFARDVDTAAELIGLFPDDDHPLIVARTWQHEPAYAGLGNLAEIAGDVFAVEGQVTENIGEAPEWLGDSRRAGGGVLLCGAYEVVDAVVTLLGLPEAVYAARSFTVLPGQARPHDTEDAAAVVFRYCNDRAAGITCRRAASGGTWTLTLAGTRATVTVTPKALTVTDENGKLVSETFVTSCNRFAPQIGAVAVALAAKATPLISQATPLASQATTHLGTLATLAAAYLSIRTGQAESPRGVLELATTRRR